LKLVFGGFKTWLKFIKFGHFISKYLSDNDHKDFPDHGQRGQLYTAMKNGFASILRYTIKEGSN